MNIEQLQIEIKKIIKDVESGKGKPDSVPGPQVHFNCQSCGAYYSKETAPKSELDIVNDQVKEILFCDCHGDLTELIDCQEHNFNSPFMSWQKEELERLKHYLQDAEEQVTKHLDNYLHRN